MTKDILLKIQGMHFGEQIGEEKDLEEEEPIEVITCRELLQQKWETLYQIRRNHGRRKGKYQQPD